MQKQAKEQKKSYKGQSLVAALVLAGGLAGAIQANAIEPLFDFGIGATEYKTDDTKDGMAYMGRIGVQVETNDGQFHRLNYSRSLKTDAKYNGVKNSDDKLEEIRYHIGKVWYPQNHASDYSMWTGLGHLGMANKQSDSRVLSTIELPSDWAGTGEITFTDANGDVHKTDVLNGKPGDKVVVSVADEKQRKMKLLYIPFGFEAGIPFGNSTKYYFVAGGEVRYIFNANFVLNDTSDNKSGGVGSSFWLGADFRLANSVIEARLSSQTMKIEAVKDYKYQANQINITYRF